MKKILFAILLLAFCSSGNVFAQTGAHHHADAAAEITYYTCGMHPQVIQDHPGNCPICGMKLTPVLKSATASTAIAVDSVMAQNMNLRTDAVRRGAVNRTIRTFASIDFDETHLADMTARFKGQIETLRADSTGQLVHRGDPLFDVYSAELYDAQVDYLTATWLKPAALNVTDSAKTNALIKLKFYGFSDEQIAELKKSRKPQRTVTIRSPADGFVIEKMVVQGQAIDEGMKLYRIADLGLVWVQAQIYEQDLPFVTLGQEADVSLSYLPDRKFRGRVTYIYPTVDEKTRTAKVRMEFHNPGYLLKPGMFATVELKAQLAKDAVLVPDSAVLRSGEKNTVFVALDGGKFDPRAIALGPRGEGNVYQVLSGLNEGERVVTSGQFMLDSESQLREAIQKMINPNATNPPAPAVVPSTSSAPPTAASTNIFYICPMPEHVSIRYDHAGKCPLCGMTLVPVTESMLEKVQPGGQVLYYTCPMTEGCPTNHHGFVKSDKPGKCPVCGMTLIPVMKEESKTAAASEVPLPKLYTCPMSDHADVVSDKPGNCPKCGMKLVPTDEIPHGKIAEENWIKQHERAH